jgi:hypothetical protein
MLSDRTVQHNAAVQTKRPNPSSGSRFTAGAVGVIVAAEQAARRRGAAAATDIQARIVQLLASLDTAGGLEGRLLPSRPHP